MMTIIGVDEMAKMEARTSLVRAALSYAASELGDPTNAYYDAQLELSDEILHNAALEYVKVINGDTWTAMN